MPEIADESLGRIFPTFTFFALHYSEWPRPGGPPTSGNALTSRNVLAVAPDGSVTPLTEAKGLEDFFRKNTHGPEMPFQPSIKSKENNLFDILHAWLRITEEFSQDGAVKFEIRDDLAVAAAGTGRSYQRSYAASGIVLVDPSVGQNFGSITAIIEFAPSGILVDVLECRNISYGERPICQALLLLDPDSAVREGARQALLRMGRITEEYLKERRAEASPELRREIDRVWAEIVATGR